MYSTCKMKYAFIENKMYKTDKKYMITPEFWFLYINIWISEVKMKKIGGHDAKFDARAGTKWGFFLVSIKKENNWASDWERLLQLQQRKIRWVNLNYRLLEHSRN